MPSALHDAWLDYARRIVSNDGHIQLCGSKGGSNPVHGFDPEVRWPGYLGHGYQPGGLLWVSNVHRNFDSEGLPPSFAAEANECIRGWKDGTDEDDEFLGHIQAVYERGLATWKVRDQPERLLDGYFGGFRSNLPNIAYTNAARCQAPDGGQTLQKLCLRQWPIHDLVDLLQPGLVILTSATVLKVEAAPWPCPVVAFHQWFGTLLDGSPWKPSGIASPRPRMDQWAPQLAHEWGWP